MINKSFKKIWLICLWVASLCLVWCFHIPDEDWLPSRNKVKTEEVEKDVELEQAVDSFINWIDQISSEWNEMKNGENNEVDVENLEDDIVEMEENIDGEENIENEEVVEDEGEVVENEEVVENVDELVEDDSIYEE